VKPSDFEALTFDVYGTLIDWEPSLAAFLSDWAGRNGVEATAAELLKAYDDARAHYQALRPALLYPDVLRSCFAYICDRWRVPVDAGTQEAFAASVKDWEPFADTRDSLAYLKEHYKLGALSNIDEESFRWSAEKMGVDFDLVVTAERVGSYKPSLPHFVTAISELGGMGIPPERILHVCQSLRADVRPGNELGLVTAWINRKDGTLGLTGHGAEGAVPDMTFASLAELVEAHRKERA
jgi:2-haloalkanoic acid dehalogenase type II